MSSIPLIASIFGLASAILWGTAVFFAAKASKHTSPEATAVWVSIIGTVTYAIMYAFNQGDLSWTFAGLLYAAIAGICLELGLYMFYRGLNTGPVSIVSPISSAYPLISTVVVLVFLGASLRRLDVLGILIVVAGIVTASGLFSRKEKRQKLTPGLYYGLLTLLLWGVAYALLGQAVSIMGWQKATLINTSAGLMALLIVLLLTAGPELRKSLRGNYFKEKFILGTAFIQLLGGIIFTIGLAHTHSSAVIIAISATYPALTIFLALKHFGEKKQIASLAGACVTIIGVIILTV